MKRNGVGMISFSAARLEKETIELTGEEPAEFLELDHDEMFQVVSPVKYRLNVERASGGALVRGSCGTVVAGKCGRCLAAVEQPVEARDIAFFVEIPDGMEICDISEDIREELLLELPMNLLCDPDCRGLCPVCGTDLNHGSCSCRRTAEEKTGSVWDALDDLKLK